MFDGVDHDPGNEPSSRPPLPVDKRPGESARVEETGPGGVWRLGGNRLIAGIILLLALTGILALTREFQRDYSLFLDECAICMNVFDRSVPALTKTLEYRQAAPIGYLVLQKAVFSIFGMTDWTMRFIPFLFGLATVPLSVLVSKRVFRSRGSTVALVLAIGLICLNRSIATYSSLAKQYTLECFVTLVLIYIFSRPLLGVSNSGRKLSSSDWWVIFSPLLVWLSYGAVFILAGFGLVFVIRALTSQGTPARSATRWFCLVAVVNLALFFMLSARSAMANRWLAAWWASAYLPLWPPAHTFSWLLRTFTGFGEVVIQRRLALLLPLSLIVTSIYAVRQRSWFWLGCLASVLACLAASALGKYPFADRLLFFLIPIMALIVAKSIDLLDQRWSRVSILAAGLILLAAGAKLIKEPVIHGMAIDRVREIHREMLARFAPGDDLWVAPSSEPCFRYYARQYPLPPRTSVHILREAETLTSLPRGRHWLLAMRIPADPAEGDKFFHDFARLGRQKDSIEAEWTKLRLFVVP